MSRLGTVSFQTNDDSDVFLVAEVREEGVESSDENLLNIEDTQFDSGKAWVTGKVPQVKSIAIEGDTAIVHAWFRGEFFDSPFVITVYLECEEAEEFLENALEPETDEQEDDRDLEPQIIEL